ncbi:MAG: hypothetical protein Q8905_05470, partial [Bacteroidota bacterium]|nr:hypothetical protein [Bacteroidota bacterium]
MFHLRTIVSTINKKKTVFFILLILFNILFYACNKENSDNTAGVFKGTINGEAFSPTIDTITKSGESYTLTFSDGNRKIVLFTNNISDGTYV